MTGAHIQPGRAVVTFEAPQGTEAVVLHDGDVATFGRAKSCSIRFGHAPTADTGVPRVAGLLVVANQRVYVESTPEPSRPVPEVLVEGQPPFGVAIGTAFSPAGSEFRILIRGDRDWRLHIRIRTADVLGAPADAGPVTKQYQLRVTPSQRRVLTAYVEPLRRGRREPATHRQVANALGLHPNSARDVIYEMWSRMFAAGIPMPDRSDKRDAVVEAVMLHGLLA